MTKTEERLLAKVRAGNEAGALVGLFVSPEDSKFKEAEFRFVRRLNDRGELVWMPCSAKFGAGWCLREFVETFYRAGYRPY